MTKAVELLLGGVRKRPTMPLTPLQGELVGALTEISRDPKLAVTGAREFLPVITSAIRSISDADILAIAEKLSLVSDRLRIAAAEQVGDDVIVEAPDAA